jgi:putative membrane-bound dehydrogenase-like protein
MPDYPTGPAEGAEPQGRVKILQDLDRDGRFDIGHLFAEGLDFATGVQPYRDGAIVTVAGRIDFIRDRDGDNRGDEVTTWFRGFARENQQLRANHPTLGPDGRIYVANGLRGGQVEAVDSRFASRAQPLELRDHDFAFDPESGWWGLVPGNSQFGLSIDDFGRRIGCSNRNPAMTSLLGTDAIERDPFLISRDAILDVAAAAENSRVFPRTDAWTTSNLHSGQFSAACGVYAPGWMDQANEWMLVCEPTGYLVQRQSIHRQGSAWTATRREDNREFLASTNTWFRPVDLAPGPATSLMVVDMARAVIEHPEFMPAELKSRPDQRWGDQLGRIWQVAPSGPWPSPESLETVEQAIQWLRSPSPWMRQMASQFLLESEAELRDPLSAVVLDAAFPPPGRARAMWLLNRRQWMTDEHLNRIAIDKDARLRALAAEMSAEHPDWFETLIVLCADPDAFVRRSAANAVGRASDRPEERAEALVRAASMEGSDRWIERTVASSHGDLVASMARRASEQDGVSSSLLGHLIARLAIDTPATAHDVLAHVIRRDDWQRPLGGDAIELLEAWLDGMRRGKHSVGAALKTPAISQGDALAMAFQSAADSSRDGSLSPSARARCLKLALAAGNTPPGIRDLFAEDSPPEVRAAVLAPLLRNENEWMRSYLREHLTGMSIPLRRVALGACESNTDDTTWLLNQIVEGVIPKTLIDPEMGQRLRRHPIADVAKKAEDLFRADPNRARVLSEYAASAMELGDPRLGRELFIEHCSACHHIDGVGTNVGPDISDTRTKTADALLVAVLDPNAAIDAAFVQYQVLTNDGRILDGLLIDETADSITLQQKGGARLTIARSEMERMRSPGVSLMPEGFERSLDTKAMSHLLSFLKNWRYLKTAIPGTLSP